jgi:hypothetical protein
LKPVRLGFAKVRHCESSPQSHHLGGFRLLSEWLFKSGINIIIYRTIRYRASNFINKSWQCNNIF